MANPKQPEDKWIKTTLPLPPGHGWRCKEGNKLLVADRGAAALEVPGDWVVRHDKQSLIISDKTPPADEARITLTVFHLPPVQGGWRQLPLDKMMRDLSRAADDANPPQEIHTVARPGLELVWTETPDYPDPESGRTVSTRQILARANLVQILISYSVYRDERERFESAWNDLLRTLPVGVGRSLLGDVGN